MKKWISVLLVVVCLMPIVLVQAFAEAPVEPAKIVVGEPLVLEDLMDFTIKGTHFDKTEISYGDEKNYSTNRAGPDYKYFTVDCSLLNTTTGYYTYDTYITNVKLVYKDKFEFEPTLMQNFPDKKYPIKKLWDIQSLILTQPMFLFKVPNVVQTTLDPIMLYLTIDGVDYVCQLR